MALRRAGAALVGFTTGSASGRARAQSWLDAPAALSISELVVLHPDVYFVCVPDDLVPTVSAELGAALQEATESFGPGSAPPVVAHTSGATSVSVLLPCEAAGAAGLVFHPLQTFPEPVAGAARFAGAGVALTPGPARPDEAGTMGLRLAEALGMRPFFLADEKRSLYHAAATVACNYLVTLEYLANELFVKAGVPERVTLALFLPLVETTLQNVADRGPEGALTGPLSRGDVATIAGHLQALTSDAPEALTVYRGLGLATLELVATRGELSPDTVDELRLLLTGRPATGARRRSICPDPAGTGRS